MFLEKVKKFKKCHRIVHVFGEGKEISEIAYDSPCFWRKERNFKIVYDSPHFWRRERSFKNCI